VKVADALHRLSQLHEDAVVVAWWQARTTWISTHLFAERRRTLLSLAAVVAAWAAVVKALPRESGHATAPLWLSAPIALAIVFGLLYGCYLAAVGFTRLPSIVRRRPQVALHAVFWGMLALVWLVPAGNGACTAVLVSVATLLPFLLWRCGYLLKTGQRGKAAGTRFADHLFYLHPAWGDANVPIGKGFDHLVRHEAHSPEAFARAQLAGMKLLALALLWSGAQRLMAGLVYGDPGSPITRLLGGHVLHVPRLDQLLERRAPIPLLVAWGSLYVELVREVLKHAAHGHVTVGALRLLGFNVFRNTYKPLLAESIVEFWNRYYYYFKELLVDFFFFPTFVRHFRTWPRVRMIVATFAAAFVGNMYYHALNQDGLVLHGDLRAAWGALRPRLLYCLLLAIGISVSMLREQKRRGTAPAPRGGLARGLRIAGVWTFFAVIHIWSVGANASFTHRTRFFLTLVGLG
jgi:hypothetical protein